MADRVKAVLLDWGETLVVVPNMLTSVDQHIACLEQIFFQPCSNGKCSLPDYGITWASFREAYVEATRVHIHRSRETKREHRFEERFVHALKLAGAPHELAPSDLAHLAGPFASHIVRHAELID